MGSSLIKNKTKWLEYCKNSKDKNINRISKDFDKQILAQQKDIKYVMQSKEAHREYMKKYYQANKDRWNTATKAERDHERTYIKQDFSEEDLIKKTIEKILDKTWEDNQELDFHNVYKAVRGKCMQCMGSDIEIRDLYYSEMRDNDRKNGDKVVFCKNFLCPLYSFRFGEPWREIKKQEE